MRLGLLLLKLDASSHRSSLVAANLHHRHLLDSLFLAMSSVDINLENQVFDLVFHPSRSTLYAALLTGEVKVSSEFPFPPPFL